MTGPGRLPAAQRVGFVDRLVALAVHEAGADAQAYGVGPGSTEAVGPDGYPVLRAVTRGTRSASWMLRHRTLLERAVGSGVDARLQP